jgi:hypothetical protein
MTNFKLAFNILLISFWTLHGDAQYNENLCTNYGEYTSCEGANVNLRMKDCTKHLSFVDAVGFIDASICHENSILYIKFTVGCPFVFHMKCNNEIQVRPEECLVS